MSRTMDESRLAVPVSERDHILGSSTAPVTLVEYGDFECPHCGRAHPILQQLLDEVGDEVALVFRHFPLSQIHPHAQQAAESAEAAGAQDRFWEMHDMLFEHQNALDEPNLVEYGKALGLDAPRFAQEVSGGLYVPVVREQFMSGVRSGVNGTPTFFINGRRHDGPWDLDPLLAAINAEIARHPERPKASRKSRSH